MLHYIRLQGLGFAGAIFSVLLGMVMLSAASRALSPGPTQEQIAAIRASAERLPAPLHRQFEERFAAWKKTWQEPAIAVSSNPRSVTHSKEFRELVALGKDIIPVIAEKLLEPDNFFALQLYDMLQDERQLVVASPEDAFDGEQARAKR